MEVEEITVSATVNVSIRITPESVPDAKGYQAYSVVPYLCQITYIYDPDSRQWDTKSWGMVEITGYRRLKSGKYSDYSFVIWGNHIDELDWVQELVRQHQPTAGPWPDQPA